MWPYQRFSFYPMRMIIVLRTLSSSIQIYPQVVKEPKIQSKFILIMNTITIHLRKLSKIKLQLIGQKLLPWSILSSEITRIMRIPTTTISMRFEVGNTIIRTCSKNSFINRTFLVAFSFNVFIKHKSKKKRRNKKLCIECTFNCIKS